MSIGRGRLHYMVKHMLCLAIGFLLVLASPVSAQVRRNNIGGAVSDAASKINQSSSSFNNSNSPNAFFNQDSTNTQGDSTELKGLIYYKEIPDSVLRAKVFYFYLRPNRVWIDTVFNPSLDPTGVQYNDCLDAINGNYYLGKGALGHPHIALFPTLADGIRQRLQPDLFEGYRMSVASTPYYQTLTPYSLLSYGGSLAKDHQLRVLHTQNILPGWNAAFEYLLLNPEGVYTSSGAVNHYLNASTNYFSPDSRLQASAAIVHQSYNIDENGGLANDSIFILNLQSNRAGIPVVISNARTRVRELDATANVSYSLEPQSESYRYRDSLSVVHINDSITRLDTIILTDTIPLHKPHVFNWGVIGMDINAHRDKRVFTDSTLWREQWATLYWTNDAYADHRWLNPLKVTLGFKSQYLRAIVESDTMRHYAWLNPFARTELSLKYLTIALTGELQQGPYSNTYDQYFAQARLSFAFDSARNTTATISATSQSKTPDHIYHHHLPGISNVSSQAYSFSIQHKELIHIDLRASHSSPLTWFDTALNIQQGLNPLWLLQARLFVHLHAGPFHLQSQQLLQHCTDAQQLPLPLWASKNSVYADFYLFRNLLHAQVGTDIRYHTPFHAPLYNPQNGLFLHQDNLLTGGYIWADVYINIQVKRASIYLKAGHVNALWENPSTYFLLPHYPGQKFGLAWGLIWRFFD